MSDEKSAERLTTMANEISVAISHAVHDGADPQDAIEIAAMVIADYCRSGFGDEYLNDLATLIIERGDDPMPPIEVEH